MSDTTESALRDLAKTLDESLGGLGFAFFIVLRGQNEAMYASNGQRPDVCKLLEEWGSTVTSASMLRGETRARASAIFRDPNPIFSACVTLGEKIEQRATAIALFVFEWHIGGQIAWHLTSSHRENLHRSVVAWVADQKKRS